MIFADGAGGLLVLALWLFCLFDVIATDPGSCRHLPKGWWLVIVFLGFDVGSIIWLVAGHPWAARSASTTGHPDYPEYDRPGRFAATDADDDDAFLQQVRARAEEQRATYRAEQLRKQKEQWGGGGPDQPEERP